jgi:hypothetical protein
MQAGLGGQTTEVRSRTRKVVVGGSGEWSDFW